MSPRDNGFLAFFTLGEGYHNYHHAFPLDYRNGVRWYQFDPTKWLIWSLDRVGLATRLKRVPVDMQVRKRVANLREAGADRIEGWSESLRSQLAEAEQRFDAALADAKAMRQELARKTDELQRTTVADLKRRLAAAERALRDEAANLERILRAGLSEPAPS